MTHASPSQLSILLISPDGASVTLRNGALGDLNEVISTDGRSEPGLTVRTVNLQSFVNKAAKGIWKLRITDNSFNDTGKLKFVKLLLKVQAGS